MWTRLETKTIGETLVITEEMRIYGTDTIVIRDIIQEIRHGSIYGKVLDIKYVTVYKNKTD